MTYEVPKYRWSRVVLDLFGCLGKEYIITVVFYFDLWELESYYNIGKCRINFSRHGIAKKVISDNGLQFTSEKFAHFSEMERLRQQ